MQPKAKDNATAVAAATSTADTVVQNAELEKRIAGLQVFIVKKKMFLGKHKSVNDQIKAPEILNSAKLTAATGIDLPHHLRDHILLSSDQVQTEERNMEMKIKEARKRVDQRFRKNHDGVLNDQLRPTTQQYCTAFEALIPQVKALALLKPDGIIHAFYAMNTIAQAMLRPHSRSRLFTFNILENGADFSYLDEVMLHITKAWYQEEKRKQRYWHPMFSWPEVMGAAYDALDYAAKVVEDHGIIDFFTRTRAYLKTVGKPL
ncbi:hypothetical protein MMC25_007264 [Agyrium rufum]|nr:hypothetical protein [Agyrium rufum]